MTPTLRVVLDTNVVVSALVFNGGRLAPLRVAWQAGQFQPLVSKATVTELLRVLAYPKFQLTQDEREYLMADYLPYCLTVHIPAKPPRIPRCRDPFGATFLYLALAGKADYLVTGDKDLLALADEFSVPILTAAAFLSVIAQ